MAAATTTVLLVAHAFMEGRGTRRCASGMLARLSASRLQLCCLRSASLSGTCSLPSTMNQQPRLPSHVHGDVPSLLFSAPCLVAYGIAEAPLTTTCLKTAMRSIPCGHRRRAHRAEFAWRGARASKEGRCTPCDAGREASIQHWHGKVCTHFLRFSSPKQPLPTKSRATTWSARYALQNVSLFSETVTSVPRLRVYVF